MKKLLKKYGRRRMGQMGGKRKGFTLIELLIVLTILAILVAVVAISLTQFVGRGKTEACKTDQRTLQSAVVVYHSEVGAWPSTDLWGAWTGDTPPAAAGDLEPTYVIDIPDSDKDCDWRVSSDGLVYVPDANVGADKCPCCEAAADHTWCGTPGG